VALRHRATRAQEGIEVLRDVHARPLHSLRLSVTDRCNLRCAYCMPEREYAWLPRHDLLTFEELDMLAGVFASLGVDRVRLTGGEPLLRRELPALVRRLAGHAAIRDLALTTNGLALAEHASALREAGLGRVTVSLDTLRPERFRALTRRDGLERVLEGLAAVPRAGFRDTKIDCVVLRGVNDDELGDLLEHAAGLGAEVRFIEYMDVGGATRWSPGQVVTRADMLAALSRRYGTLEPIAARGSAPAERFRLADGRTFGIIASTTAPFCGACDRGRLTADGQWLQCLYATRGLDLRTPLRAGASGAHLAALVRAAWTARRDRGAEERLAAADRGSFVAADALRRDPHLEMHTRGG
jgi:cyclic pyranopterin phosphate synthase